MHRRIALIAVSIGVPLLLLLVCASLHRYQAQPSANQNKASNAQTAPLGTSQQLIAPQDTTAANPEPPDWDASLWACLSADVTPQWALVLLTVIGAWVAWSAFTDQRDAVRLTQRAYVLLDAIGIDPAPIPRFLSSETKVAWTLKNFGPTPAVNVLIEIDLEIEGRPRKWGKPLEPLPEVAIAANDHIQGGLPLLGELYDDESIRLASRGNLPFFLKIKVSYKDVFGKSHHAFALARYHGTRGHPNSGFLFEKNEES